MSNHYYVTSIRPWPQKQPVAFNYREQAETLRIIIRHIYAVSPTVQGIKVLSPEDQRTVWEYRDEITRYERMCL